MVDFYIPENLKDALDILRTLKNTDYLIYAGGTDINSRGIKDRPLVFIGKVPELKNIEIVEDQLHIGACVTYSEAAASPIIPDIMKNAIYHLAGPAVRNAGTFGGNLANGSGKADTALVDMVLDARIELLSAEGPRYVEAGRFYPDQDQAGELEGSGNAGGIYGGIARDIRPGELITKIIIPLRGYFSNFYYHKVSARQALAISNLTICSVWNVEKGVLTELALGLGAAAVHPVRCADVEKALVGSSLSEVELNYEGVIDAYVDSLVLPPDRTSREYRQEVCRGLMKFVIKKIIQE